MRWSTRCRPPGARPRLLRRAMPASASLPFVVAALVLSGCDGPMSTLEPAGLAADKIADLFWSMVVGAVIVWIIVIGLSIYAIRARPEKHHRRQAAILIIGGGTVFPTIILAAYLVYGLGMLPQLTNPAPEGSLRIEVTGERWWWRVRYHLPDGREFELANEVRLPVGKPVDFFLDSPDVIHSFWIPSIGGKVDMIPGRVNRLTLEPTRTGVFRGACAEYCGTSHALMNFYAVVAEEEEFEAWVDQQEAEAATPAGPDATRGHELFLANGCGACHSVRGTPADGVVGPDLTHVGGRLSIGAGIMPADHDAFYRWIAHTEEVKPDVEMPSFGMLPREDLDALAAYLTGLK